MDKLRFIFKNKNLKFISPDGYSEVVYKEKDGHLKIVTDMKNYGTYNRCPPGKAEDKAIERWKDDGMHFIEDILPYWYTTTIRDLNSHKKCFT